MGKIITMKEPKEYILTCPKCESTFDVEKEILNSLRDIQLQGG